MVSPEASCSCITRPVHRGSACLPGRARHSRGRAQSTTAVLRATIRRVRETGLDTGARLRFPWWLLLQKGSASAGVATLAACRELMTVRRMARRVGQLRSASGVLTPREARELLQPLVAWAEECWEECAITPGGARSFPCVAETIAAQTRRAAAFACQGQCPPAPASTERRRGGLDAGWVGTTRARPEPWPRTAPLFVALRARLTVEFVDESERSLLCLRRIGEAAGVPRSRSRRPERQQFPTRTIEASACARPPTGVGEAPRRADA